MVKRTTKSVKTKKVSSVKSIVSNIDVTKVAIIVVGLAIVYAVVSGVVL
ncbi:MAG: hypothetical protein Q7S22_05205 [Candidatus Micrarchaeota archaeon]|nr:hypothetical protein [Candidatus Micrarchaeota archaeon]